MIRQYFKIGWRSLWKNKMFSLINIVGLAAGLAFTLLIATYVREEYAVNSGLKDVDQLYKLESRWKEAGMGLSLTSVGPLAKELHRQFPDLVKNYYRWDGITSTVSRGNQVFREGLQVGDSSFLSMFGFNLLYGNASAALNDPFSAVITEDLAIKYFSKKDVVGETIAIESFSGTRHDFRITGVLKTPVPNSVTQVNRDNNSQIFIPLNTLYFFNRDIESWNNPYVVEYLQLQPGVTAASLDLPMKQLIAANCPSELSRNLTPYLVPLKLYYLDMDNGLVRRMVYTLGAIALFILAMAVINFINISISKAGSRMREIGVRKTLGGNKQQLVIQFLIESVLTAVLAMLLALAIYIIARPLFQTVLNTPLPSLWAFPVSYMFIPFGLSVMVGVLAGVYPAFILAGMNSINSLKGRLGSVGEKLLLRRVLVGFQFCLAVIVFSSAIIISRQIDLFFGKDLGYDKEYTLSAQLPRDWTEQGVAKMETIRSEFARMPQVAAASVSYEIPNGNNMGNIQVRQNGTDSTSGITMLSLTTDEHYAETYGLKVVAGKFFGENYDSTKVVINEKAAQALGWKSPADAIGRKLASNAGLGDLVVAGVIRDFHFGSMQQQIAPSVIMNLRLVPNYRYLTIKIKAGYSSTTIASLQQKWSQLLPSAAFEYNFMDDSLRKLYLNEVRLKQASGFATILAVIIALLGVVGLVALNIQKRIREIGIRKIVGASVFSIIGLFLKDFLVIILGGALVACPVAWLMMDNWLSDYAYRIPVSASPFLFATIVLSLVTSLLIISQTLKAALSNPVSSLRSE